jgi:hypothetical protein
MMLSARTQSTQHISTAPTSLSSDGQFLYQRFQSRRAGFEFCTCIELLAEAKSNYKADKEDASP